MHNTNYKKIIFIGTTQLIFQCALHCANVFGNYDKKIDILWWDTGETASGVIREKCITNKISYEALLKKDIMERLNDIAEESVVFSIMNPFLIPASVLENNMIKVINLHHALLPRHRGRNAEAWAIYEGDEQAGITWHYVTAGVDEGDIISQKSVELSDKFTSIKLLKEQNKLALEAFIDIFPCIVSGNVQAVKQNNDSVEKVHLSKHVPNDGYLNLNWSGKEISRFLRAMDYGILKTLGLPKIKIENGIYSWNRYKIEYSSVEVEKEHMDEECIYIYRNGYKILLEKVFCIDK